MAKSRSKQRKAEQPGERHGSAGVRPFWSGTISFGLVSVPVDLYPASRRLSASLRMLDGDGTPLVRRYYCPAEERDVHAEHLVRGYPLEEDGEYVTVSDEELESVQPRKSRDIDLRQFVDRQQVSPLHFERAYFLTPAGETTKAYRLLARVMEETGRAGIATFVMRGKEHLVAILAENGILRAETLRFAEEVRAPEAVGLTSRTAPSKKRVRQYAGQIEKLSSDALDTSVLADPTSEEFRKLIDRKVRQGEVIEAPADDEESEDTRAPDDTPDADEAPQVDLLETIRRRLQSEAA